MTGRLKGRSDGAGAKQIPAQVVVVDWPQSIELLTSVIASAVQPN